MASIFFAVLKFGQQWQDVNFDILALKKDIYQYENEFLIDEGEDDDFSLRLASHVNILHKKLEEQWKEMEKLLLDQSRKLEYNDLKLPLFRLKALQEALVELTNAHNGRIV
jgi:hypothetical protein